MGAHVQVPERDGEQGEPRRGELQDLEGTSRGTRQRNELRRQQVLVLRLRDAGRRWKHAQTRIRVTHVLLVKVCTV